MSYEFQLKQPTFDRLCASKGWGTRAEIARNIGVSAVTLSNVLNRKQGVGPDFIGRVQTAFGGMPIDSLVEIRPKHRSAAVAR